jgi:hypothetical protein
MSVKKSLVTYPSPELFKADPERMDQLARIYYETGFNAGETCKILGLSLAFFYDLRRSKEVVEWMNSIKLSAADRSWGVIIASLETLKGAELATHARDTIKLLAKEELTIIQMPDSQENKLPQIVINYGNKNTES